MDLKSTSQLIIREFSFQNLTRAVPYHFSCMLFGIAESADVVEVLHFWETEIMTETEMVHSDNSGWQVAVIASNCR